MKFIDRVAAGKTSPGMIHDYIDRWHESEEDGVSLSEYLGMTPQEYKDWVQCDRTVEQIIADRSTAKV